MGERRFEAQTPTAAEVERVTRFLAQRAADFAWQAGVGGTETAGAFVSYLARHPESVTLFMAGGCCDLPPDFPIRGCLSWHGQDGKIYHARDHADDNLARRSIQPVRRVPSPAPAPASNAPIVIRREPDGRWWRSEMGKWVVGLGLACVVIALAVIAAA